MTEISSPRHPLKLVLLLLTFLATGCAQQHPTTPGGPQVTEALLFATDRSPSGSGTWLNFGNEREPALQYGTVLVDIPGGHQVGKIESPAWFGASPASKAVGVAGHDLSVQSHDIFHAQLAAAIHDSQTHEVTLFVHGFNTRFDDWVYRVAQARHDMGYKGVTIAYSWPSKGEGFSDYFADEDTAYWAVDHLYDFIAELAAVAKEAGGKVNIVAHSMGCRVLSLALVEMRCHHTQRVFDQIVLAAPDLDADRFRYQDFKKIQPLLTRLTLYASSDDVAITASKRIHRDARAGEGGRNLLVIPGVETVDASLVEGDFFFHDLFGHAYWGDCATVLKDIAGALAGLPPRDAGRYAGLSEHKKYNEVYWEFPPGG